MSTKYYKSFYLLINSKMAFVIYIVITNIVYLLITLYFDIKIMMQGIK